MATFIHLNREENAALITEDGELVAIEVHNLQNFYDYADIVHQMLSSVMKMKEARKGMWLWTVKDQWDTLSGQELEK